MKKIILLLMVVAFMTSLMAQQVKSFPVLTAQKETSCYGVDKMENTVPYVRSGIVHAGKSPCDVTDVGQTYYNLPTNDFARNTISYRNNTQDVAVSWTTAELGNNASRGSGVNYYYAGEGWLPQQNERIESIRTGWAAHAFTEEGEIVVAHDALDSLTAGLVVNTRAKWGEGEWQEYKLLGPAHCVASGTDSTTSINWPTIASNGNIVHMVCVTSQSTTPPCGYLGHNTVPLYYRSSDGGLTWEIKAHDFLGENGMTEDDIEKTAGDNYVLAVKGDHIVLAFGYQYEFIKYMESLDGGNTWTKKEVYDAGTFKWGAGEAMPWRVAPRAGSAYIDENDVVHVAFSSMLLYRVEDIGANSYNYWPWYTMGIFYWNSTKAPITKEEMAVATMLNPAGSNQILDEANSAFINYPGYIKAQSVLGYDDFYYWDLEDCPEYNSDQFRNQAFAPFPRVLAKDGRVYVSYQSHIDYPLIEAITTNFYKGIFLTVSEDGGNTWDSFNNTSWLSYHPFTFYCNWENYPGPYYVEEGGEMEPQPVPAGDIDIIWPTDNGYPTMGLTANNDRLLIQWYSCYKPLMSNGVVGNEAINVFVLSQSLGAFPKYANIQEVWKGLWDNIGISETPTINTKIYPNPASNNVTVQLEDFTPFTLTVSNMMGQMVHTMKGQNKAVFDVSHFAPGIYIVNVKTAHAVSTQKLIVR